MGEESQGWLLIAAFPQHAIQVVSTSTSAASPSAGSAPQMSMRMLRGLMTVQMTAASLLRYCRRRALASRRCRRRS
jgi:hypothetical protein